MTEQVVKKSFLLLIMCIFSIQLFAQTAIDKDDKDSSSAKRNFTFAIQPMQWFNWAWRLDFETRLGNSPGWLQIGTSLYNASLNENYEKPDYYYYYDGDRYKYHGSQFGTHLREPFTKLKGGGIDVNYKRFIEPKGIFYFAAGLSYSQFVIKYWGWEWDSYKQDDLQYHFYTLDFRNQNIKRMGLNSFVGIQTPDKSAFVFDAFWGFAYRHSFVQKNKPSFDENIRSYGYTGLVFLLGIRLGFRF